MAWNVRKAWDGLRYAFSGAGAESFFGPGQPLPEVAPSAEGRQYDFPVAGNIQIRPRAYEQIGFDELQNFAQNCDLLRLMIETRKDQVSGLAWKIKAREGYDVPAEVIDSATRFFKRPDGRSGFDEWVRILIDDLLVIDAPTLYRNRDKAGKLVALEPIYGGTIKPIIGPDGRAPLEGVAYQQIIKGLPAVDYTPDDIAYRPRNRRSHKAYGMSPVEQIANTIRNALARQAQVAREFDGSNVPTAVAGAPETWNPEQIELFQRNFDAWMMGDPAMRSRMRIMPKAMADSFKATAGSIEQKTMFDEWVTRVICFAFSIEPTPFIAQTNRSVAETAREQSLAEGIEPIKRWLKGWIDDELARFWSPSVEFVWDDQVVIDALVQAQIAQILVTAKIMTPDEIRERDYGLRPMTPEQLAAIAPPAAAGGFGFSEPSGPMQKADSAGEVFVGDVVTHVHIGENTTTDTQRRIAT